VWHLFAFTIVTSLLFSYNRPVRQALVPMLVPRRDLMNAITLNSMANNGTKVIGPAIGGLLIVVFGGGEISLCRDWRTRSSCGSHIP